MAEYWYIFRVQLYGRDDLVGRINYSMIHFMKNVIWKFLDWVKTLESDGVKIKTYHVLKYPRNMIRFRILIEGEEIGADIIKKVENDFRNRVDNYKQEGKRDHFIDNDAGVNFNNEKTLNAVGGPYGGLHALWLSLDFMNIMAELDRALTESDSEFPNNPEDLQDNVLHTANYIYKDIFGIDKTYPCICGNDIPISDTMFDDMDQYDILVESDKRLKEFKTKFNELKNKKLIEHDLTDIANNYIDLVFISFGLFTIMFVCPKCGEILDIRVR